MSACAPRQKLPSCPAHAVVPWRSQRQTLDRPSSLLLAHTRVAAKAVAKRGAEIHAPLFVSLEHLAAKDPRACLELTQRHP
jgi:hypothetical protein